MPVGQDGLKQVLSAFEQGEWDEVHLVADDVEVHLVAGGTGLHEAVTSHVVPSGSAASVSQPTAPGPSAAATATPAEQAAQAGSEGDDPAAGATVVAPSPGIFWRAPSPGAPPFTEVGARVEQGTALCIVEVMKLMNTLPAPVTGTVVEICADNGEQVDSGRPLFRIRPDGS